MSVKREEYLQKIKEERIRQFNLPGVEYDLKNGPSDWSAIIGHYIYREVFRAGHKPNSLEFEDGLIKASAVILAALENIENMKAKNQFDDGV